MKYPNGEYYVEVKDHRYKIHPTEKIILRKRDPPQSLRTPYQAQNETQIGRNQEVIENNRKIEVKNYPKNKKQPTHQQPKFKLPYCPNCKQIVCLEFDKGYYCKNCNYIINKQNIRLIKKFSDKIIIFQQDCQMRIRRLEKYIILLLRLLNIQHKMWLINYNS